MGRTIICTKCKSTFNESLLANKENPNICPVCGASLVDESDVQSGEEHPDWITWYYYGYKRDNGETALLEDEPIDLAEHGDKFFLIKEFKAPPESECGLDEVKRILRTYVPDAFVYEKEKTTYYYYKEGGGTLTDTLSSRFTPLYTFEAVDMKDAERQLKEVMPNSPLINNDSANNDKVRCPRCRSTEIQLVPRKFSLLTGFATNRYDRMCVRCKHRF